MLTKEEKVKKTTVTDEPLTPVPLDQRQSWIGPAVIFGGLEFCVPILMIGATLIGSFGLKGMIPVLLFTFLILTWVGNAVSGYMGAKTGLSSSVIARQGFGDKQAKFIIALVIGIMCMGWWAIQTSVTGNALCVILGIDYTQEKVLWAIVTTIVGLLFALPSIIGYSSMKWTDYLAVPGGLLLCIVGIYLAMKNVGWVNIVNFKGSGDMTFAAGVTMLLGMNVSQFVISADYTRYAKPTWKDNFLIPLGIIVIGVPLTLIGAVMAAGNGTADIVLVMQGLGFPVWGFLVLWLASWTSQLVNNYSMGLSFSNIINVTSNKGRAIVTLVGTFLSILLSLWGMLDHFQDMLSVGGLLYPAIAGVMFVDFFARKQKWEDKTGWNMIATIALIAGSLAGYLTTYVVAIGIPPLQSLIVTGIVYYVGMKIKAKVSPDKFTEGMFN
ncbi:MAG: cytosine permease [Lachnospiraceae bacterium]